MGYLICNKCGGYYELQKGENPDDFTNQCECDGNLKYVQNLDEHVVDELDQMDGINFCTNCGAELDKNAKFCTECVKAPNVETKEEKSVFRWTWVFISIIFPGIGVLVGFIYTITKRKGGAKLLMLALVANVFYYIILIALTPS